MVLKGFPCFLYLCIFTCRPHGKGASVVDYVLSIKNLLPFIYHFSLSPIPRWSCSSFLLSPGRHPLPATSAPKGRPNTTFRWRIQTFCQPTSTRCSPWWHNAPYLILHPSFGTQIASPTLTPLGALPHPKKPTHALWIDGMMRNVKLSTSGFETHSTILTHPTPTSKLPIVVSYVARNASLFLKTRRDLWTSLSHTPLSSLVWNLECGTCFKTAIQIWYGVLKVFGSVT